MWSRAFGTVLGMGVLFLLAACQAEPQSPSFPKAQRPVAPIVADSFSTENARDRLGEAEEVMEFAGIAPGMSVADIGAGEGYYTVRLSPMVGSKGRVLAQDIVPETRDRLAQRVQRENLDNVFVRLGKPEDPMIPAQSFDRIFLVHMYHEVTEPYEFLWNLREGLKPGGEIIVVDAERAVERHGMMAGKDGRVFGTLNLHCRKARRGDRRFLSQPCPFRCYLRAGQGAGPVRPAG